jgi:hypothetical protein
LPGLQRDGLRGHKRRIANWLDKFGAGQYARRFDENGIDATVLPDLTDQDLGKLGVFLAADSNLVGYALAGSF